MKSIDKPKFQIQAHDENQFLFERDADGKEKNIFADFNYKPSSLKDKEKNQTHEDWQTPQSIDPLVPEEDYGEPLPVILIYYII